MTYIDDLAFEIRSLVDPQIEIPADSDALFRNYAVLCLATAARTTLEDVHNCWVAWMSAINPDHPSAVPFSQLDPSTQTEDAPFLAAIRSAAAARA